MPRNGSGNYSLPTNAWNPAINGVSATPADWQALINDVAAAIQASVSADGQTPITGNLQMGGHVLTGAGAPSGAGMSLRWEQLTRGADIPSATSITIPLEGQFFAVTGTTAITGFGATIAGRLVYIKFDAGIVLTNSASFILPGGVNITTKLNDYAIFLQESVGVWRCIYYTMRASSVSFVPAGGISSTDVQAALQELDSEKLSLDGTKTMTDTLRVGTAQYQVDGDIYSTKWGSGGANGWLSAWLNAALTGKQNTITATQFIKNYTGSNAVALYWSGNVLRRNIDGTSDAVVWDSGNFNPTAIGTIGSYAYCLCGVTAAAGASVAGGNLNYSSASNNNGGQPAGTWACMGACPAGSTSLFVRVS